MSNVFLSTALIFYASEAAGCVEDDGTILEDCDGKVDGFKPASLITNISVISGLLAAFFMPIVGAIIDYTPYRRTTGVVSAVILSVIQATQIALYSSTWYAMMILQAIAGFVYQVQVLATYAYLPDIARAVGEAKMTNREFEFSIAYVVGHYSLHSISLPLGFRCRHFNLCHCAILCAGEFFISGCAFVNSS